MFDLDIILGMRRVIYMINIIYPHLTQTKQKLGFRIPKNQSLFYIINYIGTLLFCNSKMSEGSQRHGIVR